MEKRLAARSSEKTFAICPAHFTETNHAAVVRVKILPQLLDVAEKTNIPAPSNTQLTACEAYVPESGCGGGGILLKARGNT